MWKDMIRWPFEGSLQNRYKWETGYEVRDFNYDGTYYGDWQGSRANTWRGRIVWED